MLLLASLFSSSQAIQKSMFSSLNSVRRNSRNAFLPAGVTIRLSKDWAQAQTSSRVGVGLSSHAGMSVLISWEALWGLWSSWFLTVRQEQVQQQHQQKQQALEPRPPCWLGAGPWVSLPPHICRIRLSVRSDPSGRPGSAGLAEGEALALGPPLAVRMRPECALVFLH